MATPAQPQPTLAQRIRAKYPGAYDDLSDSDLESKILAKYPEYSDLPLSAPRQTPTTASVSKSPGGILPWLKNLEGDIRYGSGFTAPGKVLSFLGAQGTDVGAQAGTQENALASPVLGGIKAAQGNVQALSGKPWEGFKTGASGALQASSLPLMFLSPVEGKAAAEGVPAAASKIADAVPTTAKYGKQFQEVMGAAKSNAVPITDRLSAALDEYQSLVDAGRSGTRSVNRLIQRITNPDNGPLLYEEARKRASAISEMSADEAGRLTPVMKRALGNIRVAFNEAVGQAAEQSGKGAQYAGAMSGYARAAKLKNLGQDAAEYLGNQLLQKLPWLFTAYAGKKIYDATK